VFSIGLGDRIVPRASRTSVSTLFLVLACLWGCSRHGTSVPGETFSAGYIFPDKQSKVSHDFVVKNTTSETVRILKVDKSCTCTLFELEKFQLNAGETTKITINVDVSKGYIQKSATCILRTDHPKYRDWVYTLDFISLPFVVADPDVLNLGSNKPEDQKSPSVQNITLNMYADSKINLRRDNFTVPDGIELNISPKPEFRSLQPDVWNTRYKLSIGLSQEGRDMLSHDSHSGIISKTIQLAAGKSRQWSYSVFWQALPPVVGHPSYLNFGNLSDEKDNHVKTMVISSTTGGKFKILSIKNQSSEIPFETVFDPTSDAPSHPVRLRIGTPKLTGSKRQFLAGTIQVQTTDRSRAIVEIPWSASIDPTVEPHSPR
jgi:hypothetical protein